MDKNLLNGKLHHWKTTSIFTQQNFLFKKNNSKVRELGPAFEDWTNSLSEIKIKIQKSERSICRDVNSGYKKCRWNDSSPSFQLISVTSLTLVPLIGGTESQNYLSFQGSCLFENDLSDSYKFTQLIAMKRHFFFMAQ